MVIKINIKQTLLSLIYTLLLFFTFRIVNISLISESIYSRGSQISFLIISFLVAIKIKNKEIQWDRLIVYILFGCGIMFLSTYLGRGSLRRTVSQIYPIIGLFLLLNFMKKDELKRSLRGYTYILFFFTIINAIFCLFSLNEAIFGENLYVLGVKNQVAVVLIFSNLLFEILDKEQKNLYKIFKYINLILSTYIILDIRSGNNLLAWCIICSFFILRNFKTIGKLPLTLIFVAYIIFFVLVVEFHIQELFAGLIVGILHKDLTFSLRTQIWDVVLAQIKNNPILGYGIQESGNLFQIIGIYNNGQFYNSILSAHNTLLQTVYENGLLMLVPVILIVGYTDKKLKSIKNNIWKIQIICSFCGLLIVMFAEAIQIVVLLDLCLLIIALKKLEY